MQVIVAISVVFLHLQNNSSLINVCDRVRCNTDKRSATLLATVGLTLTLANVG